MLDSLEQVSVPGTMYRILREAIINGDLRPGQTLRQEELARQLGASRAPLREALPRLEAEGLIIAMPRRGYAVAELNPDDIREIFELRIVIEGHFLRAATKNRSAADVARLNEILAHMSTLLPVGDAQVTEWFNLNMELHGILIGTDRGPHAARVLNPLRSMVEPYIRTEMRLTGDCEQAQAEHVALVAAFIAGDDDKVASLAEEHSRNTMERLLQGLGKQSQAATT